MKKALDDIDNTTSKHFNMVCKKMISSINFSCPKIIWTVMILLQRRGMVPNDMLQNQYTFDSNPYYPFIDKMEMIKNQKPALSMRKFMKK